MPAAPEHPSETDPVLVPHPDLAGAGAAMRAQWREEQEAAARAASEVWNARRTLAERLLAHGHRGERVALTIGGHRLVGVPAEVGVGLLVLRALSGRVEVHLASQVPWWYETVDRVEGSAVPVRTGATFRQALAAREPGTPMTLGTTFDPDGLDGRVSVAADHVTVVAPAGAELVIPLTAVAWATARRD